MLIIQDVIVSEELVTEKFICDLHACKGACCTEGDYGAPLEKNEMQLITQYADIIMDDLSEASKAIIGQNNGFEYYAEPKVWGTSCHEDGACVFLTTNELGISMCNIEKLHGEGKIPFNKPVSCHLYPLRVTKNEISGFEAWNYDRWDICTAACTKGAKEKVPVYKFLKNAIIRSKGESFFEELDAAAQYFTQNQP
jgi:Fe-S-cluster containining protein